MQNIIIKIESSELTFAFFDHNMSFKISESLVVHILLLFKNVFSKSWGKEKRKMRMTRFTCETETQFQASGENVNKCQGPFKWVKRKQILRVGHV